MVRSRVSGRQEETDYFWADPIAGLRRKQSMTVAVARKIKQRSKYYVPVRESFESQRMLKVSVR